MLQLQCPCAIPFVKIQSYIIYVFKLTWSFLTKFLHSDERFNWNIANPLHLNFLISAHPQLSITC